MISLTALLPPPSVAPRSPVPGVVAGGAAAFVLPGIAVEDMAALLPVARQTDAAAGQVLPVEAGEAITVDAQSLVVPPVDLRFSGVAQPVTTRASQATSVPVVSPALIEAQPDTTTPAAVTKPVAAVAALATIAAAMPEVEEAPPARTEAPATPPAPSPTPSRTPAAAVSPRTPAKAPRRDMPEPERVEPGEIAIDDGSATERAVPMETPIAPEPAAMPLPAGIATPVPTTPPAPAETPIAAHSSLPAAATPVAPTRSQAVAARRASVETHPVELPVARAAMQLSAPAITPLPIAAPQPAEAVASFVSENAVLPSVSTGMTAREPSAAPAGRTAGLTLPAMPAPVTILATAPAVPAPTQPVADVAVPWRFTMAAVADSVPTHTTVTAAPPVTVAGAAGAPASTTAPEVEVPAIEPTITAPPLAAAVVQERIVTTLAAPLPRATPAAVPATDERERAAPRDDADPMTIAAAPAPLATPIRTDTVTPAPLDMTQSRWPQTMVDRIETLRDAAAEAADAADTRIRLVPDRLGTIEIGLRRDGDTIHVRFTAEQAETRALLQDAQPRLIEAAGERGLKLGQTSVEAAAASQQASQQGAGQQSPQQQPSGQPQGNAAPNMQASAQGQPHNPFNGQGQGRQPQPAAPARPASAGGTLAEQAADDARIA